MGEIDGSACFFLYSHLFHNLTLCIYNCVYTFRGTLLLLLSSLYSWQRPAIGSGGI